MKTKIVIGSLVGVLAVVGGYFLTNQKPAANAEPLADQKPVISGVLKPQADALTQHACVFNTGFATSYQYVATVEAAVAVQGMPQPVQNLSTFEAKLALELLGHEGGDAIVLVQFAHPNEEFVKMHGAAVGTPFLLKIGTGCDVKGFAREKTTSLKSAQAQQVAAHDFFFKVPVSGSMDVTYENGTGLARATVSNANGVIARRINSYDLAWRVQSAFRVTTSAARVVLNGPWIESFQSVEGIAGGMLVGAKSQVALTKEQALTAVAAEASRKVADYEWTNLLSGTYSDISIDGPNGSIAASIPQAERRYVDTMKNETLESAFTTMMNRVESKTNIEDQWHEMVGFLNGHPEEISEFAEGLREKEFPEQVKGVSYFVLSKAAPPEARVALIGLKNDQSLPAGDRMRASLALVTRKDVGVQVARAMKQEALQGSTGDAEADFLPRNALLHLGVLGGTHKDDKEAYGVAQETVKSALSAAGDDTYLLSPAMGAAGNLGDLGLLPTLESYTHHADPDVRALVPKSLRGYTYAQTESIWAEWLARETNPYVKEEIFDIIYHQLANGGRTAGPAIVAEAMKHLRMKPLVLSRQSIIHILGPVKNQNREAKALLIEQLATEFRSRSGLYSQISNYLAPQEIELGLALMPEFEHQYGAQGRMQAEQAVQRLELNQAPVRPQVVE